MTQTSSVTPRTAEEIEAEGAALGYEEHVAWKASLPAATALLHDESVEDSREANRQFTVIRTTTYYRIMDTLLRLERRVIELETP